MPPIPTVWWLRPDRSAARVGEHRAVVWNRVYFRPSAASRSKVGVCGAPPNALFEPNPASSIRTIRTFGAPSGGRIGSIDGKCVSGSLASYVVTPAYGRAGMGRIARLFSSIPMPGSPPRRYVQQGRCRPVTAGLDLLAAVTHHAGVVD